MFFAEIFTEQQNFERLKNREDSSDFDDSWTELIASIRSSVLCGKGVTTTRNSLELFAAAAVTTAVVVSHHALRVICGFERGSTE